MSAASEQLAAEIVAARSRLLALGVDTSPHDATKIAVEWVDPAGDTVEAAETIYDFLWPGDAGPCQTGQPEWWASPLGRWVAEHENGKVVTPDQTVTEVVAARILGRHRGTIATMCHRGTFVKHPAGGIRLRDVLDRLVR